MAEAPTLLREGDEVDVFYRMSQRCSEQRKYLAVLDPRQGAYRPRMGMSDGWVPARVVEDQRQGGNVKISYRWPHFFTNRGQMTDQHSEWSEWYPIGDVRLSELSTPAGSRPLLVSPLSRPELCLLTFRWGGMNEIVAPEQWGETGSSVSDIFVDSFVNMAVVPNLDRNFEVWTVYIEDQTDLVKIADTANLIFGPTHPVRRARRTCAMYHLYPTGFEEHCVPNCETGEDQGAALVDQKSLFRMIKAIEKAGIPTRFPHPSSFYEVLTSKRWTYMMSLVPHLRVPPTVAVPRMLVEESCAMAADYGLRSLCEVKRQQALLRGETPPKDIISKGVAKLGFSWEALDVKFWQRQDGLETALSDLTLSIEISQEMTGQPHDLESIIVQEFCEHDFELRLYAVEGQAEAIIYTKFCRIKENNEFGDFKELFSQKEAAKQWMNGDMAAMQDGERQCREISNHWLAWAQAQLCEIPPAIRFDYFVGRTPGKPGKAVVWTLEICELGFSMLGATDLPSKVFAAMLRSMLRPNGAGAGQPSPARAALPEQAAGTVGGSEAAKPTNSAAAEVEAPKTKAPEADSKASGAKGKNAEALACLPPAEPSETTEAEDAIKTDQAAEEKSKSSGGAPPVLYINVPKGSHGTDDQQKCTGRYEIEKGLKVKGMPIWMHTGGERWLYFGTDSYWYVGDEEEKESHFNLAQGYIRHKGKAGLMPNTLTGLWERGDEWFQDSSITVSSDANPSAPTPGIEAKSAKGGKGKSKAKK